MIIKFINQLEETVLAVLLAAMTLVTFTQVIARYVFNTGATWALEFTIFLFAWLVLLGMSYGVRVGAHIGVELLVRALPPRAQKVVGLIAIGLCMLYAAILFKGGWDTLDLLLMIGIEAEDVPVPLWVPTLILPVGFALLFLRFAEAGWKVLRGQGSGMQLADETKDAIEQLKQGNQPENLDKK
ncbi:MAG: TRAP transporter small permease [Gammaproteobacteria bacterium]|nr:TRAP transporter small permease [Gammaproteobacteria bacterium]MCP5424080.1 TRAP transporter small permease [Gammaproteobacteria bacterium]MCP5459475.1 TRAP transporter small permease [Gammaproteobacteria bacterium]